MSDEELAEQAALEYHRQLFGERVSVPFSRWQHADRRAWLAVVAVIKSAIYTPMPFGLVGCILFFSLLATLILLIYPPPAVTTLPAARSQKTPAYVAGP